MLSGLPAGVTARCTLAELDREYSLSEIAIITRAAPARILGREHKGHLGAGADGDVTIYNPDDDIQRMFELPRYVVSRGEVVVDDAQIVHDSRGRTLHVAPDFDLEAVDAFHQWFEQTYSIQFRNYPVDDHYLENPQVVPTR